MTGGCGLTPSLLLGCPLCDIISHTKLPRGAPVGDLPRLHGHGERPLMPTRPGVQKQKEKHARLSSSTAVLQWFKLS